MNIVLIGMRGTGKTSVGKAIAARLNMPFIDADEEIKKESGLTVAEIFAERGESNFREIEAKVCAQLLKRNNFVISLGGGAILNENTLELARAQALPVLLTASVETIYNRIKESDRPPLTSLSPIEELRELTIKRAPFYAACGRFTIETDNLSVEEVCDVVERLWRNI